MVMMAKRQTRQEVSEAHDLKWLNVNEHLGSPMMIDDVQYYDEHGYAYIHDGNKLIAKMSEDLIII